MDTMTMDTNSKRKREVVEEEFLFTSALLFTDDALFSDDEDDIAANDIDFISGAFSDDEDEDEDEDDHDGSTHPTCSCTFTGSAAKICAFCEVLKTFAFKKDVERTVPVPPAFIDKRIPRITIELPLPGIQEASLVPTAKRPKAAPELIEYPKPESPASVETCVFEAPQFEAPQRKESMTRKEKVLRWKAKRQRMLAKRKVSHYGERRTAALGRHRTGGKFKCEGIKWG
jgi:hypothetical protein